MYHTDDRDRLYLGTPESTEVSTMGVLAIISSSESR